MRRISISVSSPSNPSDRYLPGQKPGILSRVKLALGAIAILVVAASIAVAAIILGSLIAVLVGIAVIIALITWIVVRALRRGRASAHLRQ